MPKISYANKYRAVVYHKKYMVDLGSFETKERASIAERLAMHWTTRGFNLGQVPSRPKTIDAI